MVLADERSFVVPLLNTLPQGIGPVNVTMGIPLNALPVGGLLDAVVTLHCGHRSHMGYRLSDVARLLGHPLLLPGTQQQFGRKALLLLGKERPDPCERRPCVGETDRCRAASEHASVLLGERRRRWTIAGSDPAANAFVGP